LNIKQVAEIIKTANNELYIPGSSIKGMLRNVLMNYTIRNMEDKNIIKQKIQRGGNNPKNFAKDVEEYIFNCGYKKSGLPDYQDAKYDLMKFIQVSDTNTISCEEGGRIANPELYYNNGQVKQKVSIIEAIKEEIQFSFRISMDTAVIKAIARKISIIPRNKRTDWLDFNSKIIELFGLDIQTIFNDEAIGEKILKIIMDSIVDFSAGIIYKEQEWADRNKNGGNVATRMMHYYNNLPKNAVKLGWASGFPGITAFDALVSSDTTKEPYMQAIERFHIIQEYLDQDDKEFPKTHRFETFSNTKINPIGWVSIEKDQ
jgi:CRISPR type III-A-associated RAMP protein Csm5